MGWEWGGEGDANVGELGGVVGEAGVAGREKGWKGEDVCNEVASQTIDQTATLCKEPTATT